MVIWVLIAWFAAGSHLLAQFPQPRIRVGQEERAFRVLEISPGSYASLSLSCVGSHCVVTVNSSNSQIPGVIDFSGADRTIVAKVGTTPPATCSVGEWFFDTDELAGANLKICVAQNTWQNLTTTYIPAYTVATLPSPGVEGRVAVVTDASVSGSCTVGNGTALALCRDSGSAWVPLGDGGSGGGGGGGSATSYISIPAAICQLGAASTSLVMTASGYPNPVCVSGTNQTYGALEFTRSGTQAIQGQFRLAGTISTIDLILGWRSIETTGNMVWNVQTACIGDGEASDISWNTAQSIVDETKPTAFQHNIASLTGVTITGCSTGKTLFWRIFRDPSNPGDTLNGPAHLINILWVINR